ncbi:MAG: hypothetical protein H6920_05645 [Sphingomonadaceae bacterium]|nr:hypothetical protein [Sphingomonadaceae bacterium]MCP5391090.1 hypothetical protein [Sphingomonadaceae bacterium]MCP5393119.1 hypothetical protein [Sphingomonadaceae bacterium]
MRIAITAACAATLSACGPGVTEQNLPEMLEGAANFINTDGQSMMSDEIGNARISARAEGGDTLVMRIENIPTGSYTFDPDAMRKMMRPHVCDQSGNRSVIDAGGKFRIEMISNTGKASPPFTIARCDRVSAKTRAEDVVQAFVA